MSQREEEEKEEKKKNIFTDIYFGSGIIIIWFLCILPAYT